MAKVNKSVYANLIFFVVISAFNPRRTQPNLQLAKAMSDYETIKPILAFLV
jgi:hypothetical protein